MFTFHQLYLQLSIFTPCQKSFAGIKYIIELPIISDTPLFWNPNFADTVQCYIWCDFASAYFWL